MKKIFYLLTGIVLSAGVLYAAEASTVNFLNKSYNLKFSKKFSKSSYMKIYTPQGVTNNDYQSVVTKSYFTMEDALKDSIRDEVNEATKDIVNKNVKTFSPIWTKTDKINDFMYIMSSCFSIDTSKQKVACTYNSSKYFNNATEISMFSYTTYYTLSDTSDIKGSMDNEYEKLKDFLINVHSK